MHDTAIINKIIEETKSLGNFKVLHLSVGELSNISQDHLKEHLEELVDFKIKTKIEKSLVYCSCGYKGKAKILERTHDICLFSCPKCNSQPKVIKGGEIKIIGVE